MSNKQQTALDFFVEKLVEIKIGKDHYEGQREDLKNAYLKAKELEKQQMWEYIKKNYCIGHKSLEFHRLEFEQYYKETYEQ